MVIYRNKKEEIRIFETFLDTGDKVSGTEKINSKLYYGAVDY